MGIHELSGKEIPDIVDLVRSRATNTIGMMQKSMAPLIVKDSTN